MAKYTKEQIAEINRQTKMLLDLLLKKTGTKKRHIHDYAEQQFIKSNLDVLTNAEKKRFDKLVF